MNYCKIIVQDEQGVTNKISTLKAFVAYRGGDVSLVVDKQNNEE